MRAKERFSCAVGNVFNDLFSQLIFSFLIIFLMKVVELSASRAGMMVMIAQIADAWMSLVTGYLGDNVNVPFLSNKIGRRKSWHLVATFLMAIGVPLLFSKCFICDGIDQSWLPLVYFGFFSALTGGCFSLVEINHLAFITNAADKASELTVITALRTMLSFLSGVYVYVIAWALLGQDNGDNLGPDNLTDFAYLSWITTGTGVLFAIVFYIGTKERRNCLRKSSTFTDLGRGGGLFMGVFELGNQNSRTTSLAHSIVHMLVTSWEGNTEQKEEEQDNPDHEHDRQRKKSLLRKFVDVLFFEEEKEEEIDHSPSQTEKSSQRDRRQEDTETQMVLGPKKDPQSDFTRKEMVLELQKLDRDRKKSLLERVIDGLLSRSDYSQQDLSTDQSIKDHAAVDIANDGYATGDSYWKQVGLQDIQREDNLDNNSKVDLVKGELEIDHKDKPTTLSGEYRQRRNAVVLMTSDVQLGLPNFGFEHERSEEIEEECSGDTSGPRRQKLSFTFSSWKLPVQSLMNGDGGKDLELDASDEKLPTVADRSQEEDKETDSVENGCNPSAPDDKQKVLGRPALSNFHPAKKEPPKSLKNWLRDSNLYKVAIVYTCSRLLQSTVYTYLPLFLTERLLFAKEAIAYFPLVLLISASLSSLLCEKLNKKIGSKWSYLLAASLVMGGAVWSYFQTPSIRQSTYAPVILIGFGMSVMYVMALAFITELIGENKETSGAVISVITVIARLASGGLVIGIQGFYPEKGIDTNEAIGDYVQHVFVMAPGILTLVGFLLVLFFQSPMLPYKCKAQNDDIEASEEHEEKSPPDGGVLQFSSKHTATQIVPQGVNRNSTHFCREDTKL